MQYISKDERIIEHGMKVKVYKNLHNGKFSICDFKSGLVLGYADCVHLEDVEFKVSEAGNKRVLEKQQKNVHAYAIGTLYETFLLNEQQIIDRVNNFASLKQVSYDPYKFNYFYDIRTEERVDGLEKGILIHNRIFAW